MDIFCGGSSCSNIVYEQALGGALETGREKEGELASRSWNLNICIEKVDAKCCSQASSGRESGWIFLLASKDIYLIILK